MTWLPTNLIILTEDPIFGAILIYTLEFIRHLYLLPMASYKAVYRLFRKFENLVDLFFKIFAKLKFRWLCTTELSMRNKIKK